MKIRSALLIGLAGTVMCGTANGQTAESGEAISLIAAGKPLATIVIADQPAKLSFNNWTCENAALLLQQYLEQATGVKLPIRKESEQPARPLILVGQTKLGAQAGLSAADLPSEGYRVQAFQDGVAILGETTPEGVDRGTLFGVYRFLEDAAGVRWYFPGEMGTVVPRKETVSIPRGYSAAGHPAFPVRIGGISHWRTEVAEQWHPALRFGNSRGMVANHTHETWHQLYGKTHPEYFALKADGTRAITGQQFSSGQNQSYLCLSEPGVLRQHVENVDAWFGSGDATPWRGGAQPSVRDIPFGMSDTRGICQCPLCKPRIQEERGRWGKSSNIIFDFVSRYGQEVKKRHPEAVIWTLAYDHYELPPTEIKRLPDNIGITLCLIPTVVQMNHPGVKSKVRALIDAWFELVNRNPEHLIIWDYFCYPNGQFTAPTEIPHVLKEHVGYLKGKALGIFNNGFNPSTNADRPQLYLTFRIVWLMHRLLWDPELNLDQARADWCRDLFGTEAAPTMERFYRLLEDRWEKVAWEQEPTVGYVGEYSLFFETYPPAIVDELEALLQQALARAPKDSIGLRRLAWFKDTAFQPFFDQARKYHFAIGAAPTHQAARLPVNGLTPDTTTAAPVWQSIATEAATVDRIFGAPGVEKNVIKAAYDDQRLYVWAKLPLAESHASVPAKQSADTAAAKSAPAEGQKPQKSDAQDQAAFQFGVGGARSNAAPPPGVAAAATGRENLLVEKDDMFIIQLKPDSIDGYVELAINPNGAFTSKANVLKIRGYFQSHQPIPWDTGNVAVSAEIRDGSWLVLAAIPWAALPGMKTAPPSRLPAQFLRWNVKDKHNFTSWSPTLSSWDYPLSRFGCLVFGGQPQATSLRLTPTAGQVGQVSAIGEKPDRPSQNLGVKTGPDGEMISVGQRDLNANKRLEARGLLQFPLASVTASGAAARSAKLVLTCFNTIGEPPFERTVVDHIIPAVPGSVTAADYNARELRANVGVIPPPQVGKAKEKIVYTVDVTACVIADLQAGREFSSYRLRPTDGKPQMLLFRGVKGKSTAEEPTLLVEF